MRTGSSFSKQAARPTDLGLSDLVGGSVGLWTSRMTSPSVACSRPLYASYWISERDTSVRGVARQKIGRQDRWPVDRDVTHHDVARRLGVLLSLPIGMRITRDGISKPQFSSVAEGVRPCMCSRRVTRRGREP